jgi:DNA ligase-1
MQQFTELYLKMDRTTRTSEKLAAMVDYFRAAPPEDAIWAVYLMTGRKIGRMVSFRMLRNWVSEISGYPGWMVDECYTFVGDLSETLSLLLPGAAENTAAPALHTVIEEILKPLGTMSESQQREAIVAAWQVLSMPQKLVFHKLLSREFRIGVSRQMVIKALAEAAGVDTQIMAHRLTGNWKPEAATMKRFLAAVDEAGEKRDAAMPYPFMLAHPLAEKPETLGDIGDWLLEWKWDGIRAQIIRREGQAAIWSRGDELVTGAFPEIVQAAASLPEGTVLDGEIVAIDENAERPMPFAMLQRRINRKNVEMSFWPDVPVGFIVFDLLEYGGEDFRARPLVERRRQLAEILARDSQSILRVSAPAQAATWSDLESMLGQSRDRAVEGLMLKRLSSPYQAGRPTGLWWKLKVQPYTVDCVLIAAQSGHGRRAGLLTDYTFGVWDDGDGTLVPFAKAYSGLTDEEILSLDGWARRHTLEKFGPVHMVEPVRVFELGFEAIQRSTRHKSGIAVRFPRMLRERTDKKSDDADRLSTLRELLAVSEARR